MLRHGLRKSEVDCSGRSACFLFSTAYLISMFKRVSTASTWRDTRDRAPLPNFISINKCTWLRWESQAPAVFWSFHTFSADSTRPHSPVGDRSSPSCTGTPHLL
ncbi:hypothetical protein BDV06DRAFT_201372 [Aspergillus oleicola]